LTTLSFIVKIGSAMKYRNTALRILSFALPYWKWLIGAAASMTLFALFSGATLGMIVPLFDDVLAAYKRSPEVTRRRIYLETMAKIYPRAGHKLILEENLKGVLPLLSFEKGAGK
jgi:hypothetical protein